MQNPTVNVVPNRFVSGVADSGQNKPLVFAIMALLTLSLIFSFTNVFKVEGLFGVSEGFSLAVDSGIVPIIIIVYAVAIVALAVPLLTKQAWSSKFFLPVKIATISLCLWFLLVLMEGIDGVNSSGYSSVSEFTVSVTGWLFVITTIGALILSYKCTSNLKKQLR